jgi:hypothetical protein
MLLAETARREGLFDWLAAVAAKCAAGSPQRVFLLVFGVGTIVTAFLSNDVTAVVLTPAVPAAVKTAKNRPEPLGRSPCAISPRRTRHRHGPRQEMGSDIGAQHPTTGRMSQTDVGPRRPESWG